MGIEVALMAVAAGATVGKGVAQYQAASAKEGALDTEAKEMRLQTEQKVLGNYDVMEKVLDAQIAHATTTGTSFASPSFNAIQRNTFNVGSQKTRNEELEGDVAQENIKAEKANVRNTLYAQLFGDTSDLAIGALKGGSSMPTGGG